MGSTRNGNFIHSLYLGPGLLATSLVESETVSMKKYFSLDIILILVVVLTIIGRLWFFDIYRVQGDSMSPKYENGDLLWAWKETPNRYGRGDIVAYTHKGHTSIKRIVGLPGEMIEVKDHQLYINDKPFNQPYLSNLEDTDDFDKVEIPRDHYFVMGDHRSVSDDSRRHGSIPKSVIKNRIAFSFYPLKRIQFEPQ